MADVGISPSLNAPIVASEVSVGHCAVHFDKVKDDWLTLTHGFVTVGAANVPIFTYAEGARLEYPQSVNPFAVNDVSVTLKYVVAYATEPALFPENSVLLALAVKSAADGVISIGIVTSFNVPAFATV